MDFSCMTLYWEIVMPVSQIHYWNWKFSMGEIVILCPSICLSINFVHGVIIMHWNIFSFTSVNRILSRKNIAIYRIASNLMDISIWTPFQINFLRLITPYSQWSLNFCCFNYPDIVVLMSLTARASKLPIQLYLYLYVWQCKSSGKNSPS